MQVYSNMEMDNNDPEILTHKVTTIGTDEEFIPFEGELVPRVHHIFGGYNPDEPKEYSIDKLNKWKNKQLTDNERNEGNIIFHVSGNVLKKVKKKGYNKFIPTLKNAIDGQINSGNKNSNAKKNNINQGRGRSDNLNNNVNNEENAGFRNLMNRVKISNDNTQANNNFRAINNKRGGPQESGNGFEGFMNRVRGANQKLNK